MNSVTKIGVGGAILALLFGGAFLAGFGSGQVLTGGLEAWMAQLGVDAALVRRLGGLRDGESGDASTPPLTTASDNDEEVFDLFWEAWDLTQRSFYGELPSMRQMTYGAIRGMLEALNDDYTAFIEPDVAAILAEDASGEFEGIGAHVDLDETGRVRIVGVFEGGPADIAGLQANDVVVEVDGVPVVGTGLYGIIGVIRGPEGTDVVLLVERRDIPGTFEITVTRARLEIPVIEARMYEDQIGYIRLNEFSASAGEQMEEGLENLLDLGSEGIVFDLRHNPGGWLDQSIRVADLFLDDGVIATQRSRDDDVRSFTARSGDVAEEVPLVVLINGGSASASEIVAGALQDHARAVLIGEQTLGKGSVQRPFTLSDGSELRVTIALWFTPNEQPVSGHGISPDIEVSLLLEGDAPTDADLQLNRALEYLRTGS